MKKIHIASSRLKEIGDRCKVWAHSNTPDGFAIVEDMEECDIFISVLYDKLVTEEFIKGRRCYNFHPGILPDYRGSGVYSWVLLNKEEYTGVTLHEIDSDIDHGRIISFNDVPIPSNSTASSLFNMCMDMLFVLFKVYYSNLLLGNYGTISNEGGHLYLRKDLEKQKDISHIIKAFTFKDKESAYWIDSKGIQHHIHWE